MATITISSFRGLASREQKLLKVNTFAEKASNVQLHDGSLTPVPCPELVCEHGFDVQEIYEAKHCDCVAFDTPTHIEQYNDLIFYKEDNEEARMSCVSQFCDDVSYPVSIPCPHGAPSVSSSGSAGCDYQPTQYMFTYVSKVCGCTFESPPSQLSRESGCGGNATVSGFGSPPSNVTHIRIYRSDSGIKTGAENKAANNSGMLLVGEITAGAGSFQDSGIRDPKMVGLITYDMEAMPVFPSGIGATAFSVFSWVGNELYISVAGMPNVRHQSGRFCFDCKIIAAQYWNGSIYVFTERWNYRIDEAAGSNNQVSYSNPPFRFENLMTIQNEHSISTCASGVVFNSKAGIGILAGRDNIMLGHNIFNTSQWKAMNTRNMRTHVYQQYLFIFSQDMDHTHVFEFEDGVFVDREYSNHVTYPFSISAMYTTDDGDLLFAEDDSVYKYVEELPCFDAECSETATPLCQECCPYDYRIRPRHDVEITDYASAFLHIDPSYGDITFTLWDRDCGSNKVYEETFGGCGEHEFTLPSGCLTKDHTIQLTGCAKVYELRLATSHKNMGRN